MELNERQKDLESYMQHTLILLNGQAQVNESLIGFLEYLKVAPIQREIAKSFSSRRDIVTREFFDTNNFSLLVDSGVKISIPSNEIGLDKNYKPKNYYKLVV